MLLQLNICSVLILLHEPSTNITISAVLSGTSVRSGLGSTSTLVSPTQSCAIPSVSFGNRVDGFNVVHLFIVRCGCDNKIVMQLRCRAGDIKAILFCIRSAETACDTISVNEITL